MTFLSNTNLTQPNKKYNDEPEWKVDNPYYITHSNLPIALYTPKQVYQFEKSWFAAGNDSYGLMQQAAWQMSQWLQHNIRMIQRGHDLKPQGENDHVSSGNSRLSVCIWVGGGNNGGDGWLLGQYLSQGGCNVTIIEVQPPSTTDAKKAKQQAIPSIKQVISFEGDNEINENDASISIEYKAKFSLNDVHIDALFGIGLDRKPEGVFADAIHAFNQAVTKHNAVSISVDMPSGLLAGKGQVFDGIAVKAQITLCLVARKVGLHIKDGMDYSGEVVDIPLIPISIEQVENNVRELNKRKILLYGAPFALQQRQHNTHKGSFGHVLVVGGNFIDSNEIDSNEFGIPQGMGGAAIMAASSAMAAGTGKVTVACHVKFHQAVISSLPNVMTMDLHAAINHKADTEKGQIADFIKQVDSVVIGVGLGRDEQSYQLFCEYLQAVIDANKPVVIDADGLYHLASLVSQNRSKDASNKADENAQLIKQFKQYCHNQMVYFTPHSGEAARLLDTNVESIEKDRLKAITHLVDKFGGTWLLKGAGSLVADKDEISVCQLGNAGMATAGMGDILAGLAGALQAQSAMATQERSLLQAVMIHAAAGDVLANKGGQWQLQAQDMPNAIGKVMQQITVE